jgi:hypothetical protein
MPALTREGQIGFKIEATQGVEETLAATDFVGVRTDISSSYEVDRYERNAIRGTLTKLPSINGSRKMMTSHTEEAIGGTASVSPKWHDLLEIGGFLKTAVVKFSVSSVTGTFREGDIIGNNASQSSATKLGRVSNLAANVLHIMPISGTAFANADSITNYSRTGACTLSSTSSAGGFGFRPLTERTGGTVPKTGTFQHRVGGLIHKCVGAMAAISMRVSRNEPLLITANAQGIPVFDTNGITPVAGSAFGNLASAGSSPRLGLGSVLRFHTATSYAPILTSASVDMVQTVQLRETMNDNAIAASGFMPAQITDRSPTMEVDPEHVITSEGFDAHGLIVGGATFGLTSRLGALADANGLIVIAAPTVKIQSGATFGDRNGNATLPMTLGLFGNDDDELFIFHLF